MSGQLISSRNVFVLDVSGSMKGMKCETLQLSVTRCIEEISDGFYVGIVLFDDKFWIEHEVIQITDRSIKDGLIAKVPKIARGKTDIGGGLLMGLQALTQKGISTEGANIFLVTDGEDNCSDGRYVDNVLPQLLSAKVRIICYAFGNSADSNLERLAQETGGNTYIASNTNREMAARVIESVIQEVKTNGEMYEVSFISVCNDLVSISHQSIAFEVIIDSDIGRDTVFNIQSEDIDKFSVIIESPNGQKYDTTSDLMIRNIARKRYQLKLKSAESGIWKIIFVRHSNQTLSANVSVISQPLNPNAIQMRVILKDADINLQTPPIIMAEIRKGRNTVIGAEVIATVDKPNGTQTNIKLNNYNNYYMNYFTDYCGTDRQNRYNVSVLAKTGPQSCQLRRTGSFTSEENTAISRFQRQSIIGCFKIDDFMPPYPDSDQTLQELSMSEASMSKAFSSLSLTSSSSDLLTEASIPLNSKSATKPTNAKKDTQKRAELWVPYLATRKLLKSSGLSKNEKAPLENRIEEIFEFIDSPKSATVEEIQIKHQMLNEMKARLSKK